MKMISRQRSSTKRKLTTIVICGVLGVVLLQTPLASISTSIGTIHTPLKKTFLILPNAWNTAREHWRTTEELRRERDILLTERGEAATKLSELQSSITEYDAIRALRDTHLTDRIIAGVLIAPNISPYDSLVVDRGTMDGISERALVYADANTPIGIVTRVERTTAIVELFTSPGMVSNVFVLGPNVHAKAIGIGGGTLDVLMPHGVPVQEGDSVIMPTLSGERIGTVANTKSDPAEPGTIASVVGSTALSSLRFVSIDRNPFIIPTRAVIEENIRSSTSTASVLFTLPQGLVASTSSSTRQ